MNAKSAHEAEFLELWGGPCTVNTRLIHDYYLMLAGAENVVHFFCTRDPDKIRFVDAVQRHERHHSNTLLQKFRSKLQLIAWRAVPSDLIEEDSEHGAVGEKASGVRARGFDLIVLGRFHFSLSVGCVEHCQRSACPGVAKAASGYHGEGET